MSEEESIQSRIRDIIADELDCDDDEAVNPETKLQDDLGADSLDMTELAMRLEETFEIDIPDEKIEKFVTVGDIYNYMERHKK